MSWAAGGLLSSVVAAALVALSLALVMSFIRLVRGPSIPDRVVALDLIVLIAMGMVAVHAIQNNRATLLDAAVLLALIAFLSTAAFATYLAKTRR